MFAIAKSYSGCHRYIIHPRKTQVVCKHCSSAANGCARQEWNIGENVLHLSDRTTHLGLARTDKNDSAVNIEDRISLARRTGYSLMKSGYHGSNGLNPKVSYRLYQTYVLPHMLYDLEILDLSKSDVKQLKDFHVDLLRRIQSIAFQNSTFRSISPPWGITDGGGATQEAVKPTIFNSILY